jgi:dipeptidyl aminopeptidase/acylaminoacyl peptidase
VIVFGVQQPASDAKRLYLISARGGSPRLIEYPPSNAEPVLSLIGLLDDVPTRSGRPGLARITLRGGRAILGALPGAPLVLPIGPVRGVTMASEGFDDHDPSRNGLYVLGLRKGLSVGIGRLTRLTSSTRHDLPIAFSPDGSHILFLRPVSRSSTSSEANANLYVINKDGTGLHRLNPPGTVTTLNDTPTVSAQSWSPDGRQVAFVASQAADGSFFDAPRAAYVVNADGSDAHRIGATGFSAMWSPDGRWIAIDHQASGVSTLYLVHPDGSGLHPIVAPTDGSYAIGPVWSPDGKWLLYVRGTGNGVDHADLWMTSSDTDTSIQLTHNPGPYRGYQWWPMSLSDACAPRTATRC